jgi:hypothetical protein
MARDHRDKAPDEGTNGGGETGGEASGTSGPRRGLEGGSAEAGGRVTARVVGGVADAGRAGDRERLISVSRCTGTQTTPRSRSASRCAMVASSNGG